MREQIEELVKQYTRLLGYHQERRHVCCNCIDCVRAAQHHSTSIEIYDEILKDLNAVLEDSD